MTLPTPSPSDFHTETCAGLKVPVEWVSYVDSIKSQSFNPEILKRRNRDSLYHKFNLLSGFGNLDLDLESSSDPIFDILVAVFLTNFHAVKVTEKENIYVTYPDQKPELFCAFKFERLFSLPCVYEERISRLINLNLDRARYDFTPKSRISFKDAEVDLTSFYSMSSYTRTRNAQGKDVSFTEYVKDYVENRGGKIVNNLECDLAVVEWERHESLIATQIYFHPQRVTSPYFDNIRQYQSLYPGVNRMKLDRHCLPSYVRKDVKSRVLDHLRQAIIPTFMKMTEEGHFLPPVEIPDKVTGVVRQFEYYLKALESIDVLFIDAQFFIKLCSVYSTTPLDLYSKYFTSLDDSRIHLVYTALENAGFLLSPENFIPVTQRPTIRISPEVLSQKAKLYYQNQAVKEEKSIDKLNISENDDEVLTNIYSTLQSTEEETLLFAFSLLERLTFNLNIAISVGSLLVANSKCTTSPRTVYTTYVPVPETVLSKFKQFKIKVKTTSKESFIKSVLKVDRDSIHTNQYFRECVVKHFLEPWS